LCQSFTFWKLFICILHSLKIIPHATPYTHVLLQHPCPHAAPRPCRHAHPHSHNHGDWLLSLTPFSSLLFSSLVWRRTGVQKPQKTWGSVDTRDIFSALQCDLGHCNYVPTRFTLIFCISIESCDIEHCDHMKSDVQHID
jgi:hypothetical protein